MLVMPSICFETFGLVAAEAMSHGIPVIASQLGASAHILEDGLDGFLLEASNPRDLADKINLLSNDTDLCRRMGATAQAKAESGWHPNRHFERAKAIHKQVIAWESLQ